ncbi:MAG: hypothetical protein WD312_00130 [Candidatus Paceibacterota bacterium]
MDALQRIYNSFWQWYERHYTLNVTIAAILFTIQIIHLIWLYGDVIMVRLGYDALFHVHEGFWHYVIVFVDYTEIPAILSTSLIFINGLREKFNGRDLLYLVLINSQWLHLFWITDEFVVQELTGAGTTLPTWLAWFAILIDYAELPVIYATIKEAISSYREKGIKGSLEVIRESN